MLRSIPICSDPLLVVAICLICFLVKLLSDSELLSDSGDLSYLHFVVAIFYSVVVVQSRRVIDRVIDGATDRQRGRVISGSVESVILAQF